MNSVEWENLRSELTPFLNRLACAADADPGQHEQMRVALLRFQDALRDAYPPDCAVSLRSYLTRHLARFAYALDVALRPEPSASCANEILPQRSATTLSIVNADLSERSDLRGRDWLAQWNAGPTVSVWPRQYRGWNRHFARRLRDIIMNAAPLLTSRCD